MSDKMLKNMSLKVSLLCLSVLSVAAYADLSWSDKYTIVNEQGQRGTIERDGRIGMMCLANEGGNRFVVCSRQKLIFPNDTIHGFKIQNLNLSMDQTQTEFEDAIKKSNFRITGLRQKSYSSPYSRQRY